MLPSVEVDKGKINPNVQFWTKGIYYMLRVFLKVLTGNPNHVYFVNRIKKKASITNF